MTLLSKPGVPRSAHLFAAPFLWTVIGCLLIYRGYGWLDPDSCWLLIAIAVVLGSLKSLIILDAVARRSIQRIILFKDGTCLGAVYSWKTWLLVALMMTSGIIIRKITLPGPFIGTLYCAVGWSLCFSSRLGWHQWFILFKNNEIA